MDPMESVAVLRAAVNGRQMSIDSECIKYRAMILDSVLQFTPVRALHFASTTESPRRILVLVDGRKSML